MNNFWTGPDEVIPGSPLIILMSTIIFAITIYGLTIKKKSNFSI